MSPILLAPLLTALLVAESPSQRRPLPVRGAATQGPTSTVATNAVGPITNPCLTFGVAVGEMPLFSDIAYADVVKEWSAIGSFTIESAHKFNAVRYGPGAGDYDFTVADTMIQELNSYGYGRQGMAFHALFWHNRVQIDPWVETLGYQGTRTVIQEHLDAVHQHYFVGPGAHAINRVDVLNEAMGDDWRLRAPGPDAIDNPWAQAGTAAAGYVDWAVYAVERARATFPANTPLFFNDYNIGRGDIDTNPLHTYDPTGATHLSKADATYKLVRDHLQPAGLTGVGFQLHLTIPYFTNLNTLRRNIGFYADLGIEAHITELDVPIDTGAQPPSAGELQRQADVYEDVMLICVEEPNCSQVTIWGVTDRHSWIPAFAPHCPGCVDPLPHDDQGQPKPAYDSINRVFDLVQRHCPR